MTSVGCYVLCRHPLGLPIPCSKGIKITTTRCPNFLVICRSTYRSHQLQTGIRTRFYSALEWVGFPSKISATQSVSAEAAGRAVSEDRDRGAVTYRMARSSLNLASSFSSIGASMSKTVRMQAILRKMVLRAKCLPGQILSEESHTEDLSIVGRKLDYERTRERWSHNPHLLPDPNALSSGSFTWGSSFPSFRNRSGSKVRGAG